MNLRAIAFLLRADLTREKSALFTSGFGIAMGALALCFFLALGLGVRSVLLGRVFPIDRVELEPSKGDDPGLIALLSKNTAPPALPRESVAAIAKLDGVRAAYPKQKIVFPFSGHGGKEIIGRDVGASELVGEGIDESLVAAELSDPSAFRDPMGQKGGICREEADCAAPRYCERASGEAQGYCSDPVPVVVSQVALEIFDRALAPSHGLPPIGKTLVARANGVTFKLWLGESLLGRAKQGSPRHVTARLVGVSARAMDLGLTMPLGVVERWNREYAGGALEGKYTSVVVDARSGSDVADILGQAKALGLEPHDTRARDVSVLVTGVLALLSLVAIVILIVAASNIAYTFRVLVTERRAEIALYRALGARALDMSLWVYSLSAVIGAASAAVGVCLAFAASKLADVVATNYLPDFPFKPTSFFLFPLWMPPAMLVFAIAFTLVGAFRPAQKAARVSPAQALSGVE